MMNTDTSKMSYLERGDWVKLTCGEIGTIQYFGRFNGRKWVKSSRKNADGIWFDAPNGSSGYVHKSSIAEKVSPPLFQTG